MAGRRLGQDVGSEVMEAWDVIVLGDGPAALRAAAEAAKGGANTLMMSSTALGQPGFSAQDGLSASLQESNNRSHREDTIRCGSFLNDQDIVTEFTSRAVREVDLLERRGVNFHRDAQGLPMVRKAVGHSQPRTVDSGSTTSVEIQQIGEEQCMRHGVIRRGDQIPLSLVHANQSVTGVVVLDSINGRIIGLQCKALIIADEGFEGAFHSGVVGLGMDLAFRAGTPLRDMEFVSNHPLTIKGTNLFLPMGLLNDGAALHEGSGPALEVAGQTLSEVCRAVDAAVQPVLDARDMGVAGAWWGSLFRLVKQRTGIDMTRQTVPIANTVHHTVGGLSVDGHGRCVLDTWSKWFTGLYAAGDAACTGFHGASALSGNRLLDALCSGASAGIHAATWVSTRSFHTSSALSDAVEQAKADISAMTEADQSTHVARTGTVMASIHSALAGVTDFNQDSMVNLLSKLEAASHAAESLHLDQPSLIANANALEIFRTQAAVRMLTASVQSGIAREESRGDFHRSDFPESDPTFHHHTTVDQAGQIGTLPVKKGAGNHWVLPPQ